MLIRLTTLATVLLLALACSPGAGGEQPAPQAGDGEQTDASGDGSAGQDPGSVTVKAGAEVEGTCRPKPREGDDGEELIADVEVANTGDLGVKVRVAAKWPQPQGQGVIRWKRINVEQGDTRNLTLRLAVGDAEAEAVRQAVAQGRTCAVSHRVIGAFGD